MSVITECDALLRPLSGWSLLQELALPQERSRLDDTEIAQPALFALQVALAALWKSWGVSPDSVVGHSVGEIAALHVAGVLDLREAVRVVWHRGRIMQQATGLGSMASVGMTEAEAKELVSIVRQSACGGAINAPRSVVLSGESAALEAALTTLTANGVSHRMLAVQYAFHSSQMAPFQHQLVEQLGVVRAAPPTVTVYSTVTGGRRKMCASTRPISAEMFAIRYSSPAASMQWLRMAATFSSRSGRTRYWRVQSQNAILRARMRRRFWHLCVAGGRSEKPCCSPVPAPTPPVAICDWERSQPTLGQVVDLPGYPWQRKRHWIRARPTRSSVLLAAGHPMLGHQNSGGRDRGGDF